MAVHIVNHPLVRHKLGILRQASTSTHEFRAVSNEVARLLIYEATKNMLTETLTVQGWAGPVDVEAISGKKVTVVPILRAGLGLMDGVLDMIPGARISVGGMYRNESTLEPVEYYVKLASDLDQRLAIILDPMLATGGSIIAAIDLLKKHGCRQICSLNLVCAPEGIAKVEAKHPDVDIYTAAGLLTWNLCAPKTAISSPASATPGIVFSAPNNYRSAHDQPHPRLYPRPAARARPHRLPPAPARLRAGRANAFCIRRIGAGAILTGTGQQCGPVHGGRGHTALPALHQRQGAHLPGLFLRFYRAHHLRRADLGHAANPGRAGLLRLCLLYCQRPGALARHRICAAPAATHRHRAGHHGHRAHPRACGRQPPWSQNRRRRAADRARQPGPLDIHDLSGGHGAGFLAGQRLFAAHAHPLRHRRRAGRLPHPGRGRLGAR